MMNAPDLERIRDARHFIAASDRDTWLFMGMSEESERDGLGRLAREHRG